MAKAKESGVSRIRVGKLCRAVQELQIVGGRMSNLCFNLMQNPKEAIGERNAEAMKDLYRQWDHFSAVVYGQVKRIRAAQPKRKAKRNGNA